DVLAFSADGRFLVAGGSKRRQPGDRNHEIKMWTLPGGKLRAVLTGPEYCIVKSLAVSPDGKTLATGLSINLVRLWDIDARKEIWKSNLHGVSYDGLTFSTDGHRLAVSGLGEGMILDIARPNSGKSFGVPRGDIEAICSTEPDRFLVTAGDQVHQVD